MREDALGRLAAIEHLAPREAILARALIRHGLAPAEEVLAAALATAAEPSGGLLDRLGAAGVLTEEKARFIEQSLEKKIARRRAAAAGGSPDVPVVDAEAVEEAEAVEDNEPADRAGAAREPELAGTDETVSETGPADGTDVAEGAGAAEEPGAVQEAGEAGADGSAAAAEPEARRKSGPRMWRPRREREPESGESVVALYGEIRKRRESKQEEEAVSKFLDQYVASRLHQLVIEKLARMRAGVADPKSLARTCGAKEKEVVRVLKDLKTRGLLRTVHTFPYYYDPAPKVQETAALFMKAWRDPVKHQNLLTKILEKEG